MGSIISSETFFLSFFSCITFPHRFVPLMLGKWLPNLPKAATVISSKGKTSQMRDKHFSRNLSAGVGFMGMRHVQSRGTLFSGLVLGLMLAWDSHCLEFLVILSLSLHFVNEV